MGIYYLYKLKEDVMSKLILIRGLPGSGKSTLAKSMRIDENYVHLEADMYFMKNGEYVFNQNKLHSAHEWCQNKTDLHLSNHINVIVSNTFTTLNELRPYFEIAKMYDIIPTVIYCQNQFESIHNVPEETIEKMKKRFVYDLTSLFEEFR
jgi:predicted kinase